MTTAYPWHERRDVWRTIGLEFVEICAAITSGVPVLPPRRLQHDGYKDLRPLRLAKGLTQKALARLAGCSTSAVKAAEWGRAKSATVTLIRRALEG
jgi:DNA-binding XRE family transcriptional regulator